MKKWLSLFILAASVLFARQTDTLYVLQTTDVHGNIYPYNYFTDRPDSNVGLAKVYTRVKEYRLKHKNVILIDTGDLLQGTPLAYYFNKHETGLPHPLILTMNYMGYDAFTVGNHDIEQGLFVYLKARKDSDFPWLSANAVMEDKRTFFKPYTIPERSGIKIGILGLTTPGIPMWLDKTLYPGIAWADMQETAAHYADLLNDQCDVMLGAFHAGFNAEYSQTQSEAAGLPNENASAIVADNIRGFDVVFAGHSHSPGVTPATENAPVKLNAGSRATNLAVAKIVLQKENNTWNVIQKNGWIESMRDVQPAQSILDLTEYYHKKTLDYIRTKIGTLTSPITAKEARFKDTAVIELINEAQMDHTGADISFAASFNDHFELAAGPISIKDVYGMYRYENFLYVVEMTGQQIKDFLEYSARYFILQDGKLSENSKLPGYNYDMAEGVNYEINVRKPIGQRIINMINPKTKKTFDLTKTYKVALNSYRATGGGGHMDAAGAKNNPVIFKSNEEMRNILAEYIQKKMTITPKVNNNWRIIF